MVSKASDDLPEPDRPVITTSLCRGMSTSMFLRLCTRAPRTLIHSWAILLGISGEPETTIVAPMTSFRDFEQQGWERAAAFYGDAYGGLTMQTAGAILDAV